MHTFRSGSKLLGRAANFSVRPQTFRSGSKLFCQAADCSVAHQTFRSRIKLSGRASNFSVRLCSLYNLPQAANVLQVPSVGISTIPAFYLIIISTIHQIYCNVHYYLLFLHPNRDCLRATKGANPDASSTIFVAPLNKTTVFVPTAQCNFPRFRESAFWWGFPVQRSFYI